MNDVWASSNRRLDALLSEHVVVGAAAIGLLIVVGCAAITAALFRRWPLGTEWVAMVVLAAGIAACAAFGARRRARLHAVVERQNSAEA